MNNTPTHIAIPVPVMAPFGLPLTNPESIQEIWDVFVKPSQSDDAPPQSLEMRMLMAVLRAVFEGMSQAEKS